MNGDRFCPICEKQLEPPDYFHIGYYCLENHYVTYHHAGFEVVKIFDEVHVYRKDRDIVIQNLIADLLAYHKEFYFKKVDWLKEGF